MPKILTAREHWNKAFEYYFEGDRRRTIKEARLAMKLNPNYARPLGDWPGVLELRPSRS